MAADDVAFVTGGSGFVGAHVVRALLDRGVRVRCLTRDPDPELLRGFDVERIVGSLRHTEALLNGCRGARWAFHIAADYRLWVPDPERMFAANVDGTLNMIEAAARAGVERLVYTSTVGVLGRRADGEPGDAEVRATRDEMVGAYKDTKFQAEQHTQEAIKRGMPIVTVYPSAPIGDGDIKPTPTGKMIIDFVKGKTPAYVDTGLNFVDVRDVAVGHVLAAERGAIGGRYLLGNENLTLLEFFERLGAIVDRKPPRVRLPHWVPHGVALIENALARVLRFEPRVPVDGVKMAKKKMFFDGSGAVTELGLPQTPIDEAMTRAVEWFRERGML